MNDLSIYYINLTSRPDRRDFMEQQFARLGLKAERIEAVTPRDLSAEEIGRYCNPRKYRWLAQVELSCGKSHLAALEKIARSSAPFGLVLEDDIVLSSKLPGFVELLATSASPADLVKIETDCRPIRQDPVSEAVLSDDHRLVVLRGFSWGSGGYMVTPGAARKIIDSGELLRCQTDRALFDPQQRLFGILKLRHLSPALCIQLRLQEKIADFSGSDIYPETSHRQTIERSLLAARFHHQVRQFLHEKLIVDLNHIFHERLRGAKKARIGFVE